MTWPLLLAWNCRPRLTALVSAASAAPDGVALFQMLHGHAGAVGVTELDGAEAGPVPTELAAATVNVYAVPFVKPVTVADVAGGLPVTVIGVCAVEPMYGVTV
jgi:hypothetical protein